MESKTEQGLVSDGTWITTALSIGKLSAVLGWKEQPATDKRATKKNAVKTNLRIIIYSQPRHRTTNHQYNKTSYPLLTLW